MFMNNYPISTSTTTNNGSKLREYKILSRYSSFGTLLLLGFHKKNANNNIHLHINHSSWYNISDNTIFTLNHTPINIYYKNKQFSQPRSHDPR